MVGASKILTVSYGTFSCTLEGFDEPFNTMKAIAEYFRDLAADDRYFGAEPPTPDAAMLHQIAEREMKRRVEAKVQDNGVILRATDSQSAAVRAEAPTALMSTPHQPEAVKPDTLFEDQHELAAPAIAAVETAEAGISESVAAKLSRIRSAMAETRASGDTTRPPVSLAAALAAAEAEEEAKAEAEALAKAEALATAEAEAKAKAAEEAEALAKAEAEAAAKAEELARAEAAEKAAEDARAEAEAAAKTEAIAKAQAEADAAAAKAEAEESSRDDAVLASLAGAFDDEDRAEDDRFDDEPESGTTAISAGNVEGEDTLMASLAAAMADPAPAPTAHDATVDLSDDSAEILEIEEAAVELAALDGATPDDIAAMGNIDDEVEPETHKPLSFGDHFSEVAGDLDYPAVANPLPTYAPLPTSDAAPSETIASDATSSDGGDKLQRARARVIKIRRAPAADATAPAPQADQQSDDTSALSPEAEADLLRELGNAQDEPDVAATISEASANEDDAASDIAPVKPVRPQRPDRRITPKRRATDEGEDEDASVKRLMAQTDTEFQGPENRRRLSAISHLKAAVAATVADRKVGGNTGPSEETRMTPYRNDLERAVRPRSAAAAPAAKGERPAPLMLVSEQRIDTPRVKPSPSQTHITPVRPRRLPAGNLALTEDDQDDHDLDAATDGTDASNIFDASVSFAEYAERLGAGSLSELLEAAAAYAAHIEGQADVSRPKMVAHVMSVQPDLLNDREDMLRSFGTLLREGRLEKVRRGFFALSATSPIQTEARKAAEG